MRYVINPFTGHLDAVGDSGSSGTVTGTGVATRIAFWATASSLSSDARAYWDNVNKRLGIGVDAPAVDVDVRGVDAAKLQLVAFSTTDYGFLVARRSRGTFPTTPGAVLSGDRLGGFAFAGDDGSLASTYSASVEAEAEQNFSGAAHGTSLRFYTTPTGSTTTTERMRLRASGELLVNSTGAPSAGEFVNVRGHTTLLQNAGVASELRLGEPDESGWTAFKAQNQGATVTYTLPAADAAGALNSDGAGALSWVANPVTGTGTATRVAFWTSGSAIGSDAGLYWDNTSKLLGVNVTPLFMVHVRDRTGVAPFYVADNYLGDLVSTVSGFVGRQARGTPGAESAVQAGDVLAFLGGRGWGSTAFSAGSRAVVECVASETWSDAAQGARIEFLTTANGAASAATRVTVANDGEVTVASGPVRQVTLGNVGGGRTSLADPSHAANLDYTLPSAQSVASFLHNNGSGALSWVADTASGLDHGGLVGLTDDDHVGYTRLVGRAGTANDTLLSTNGNGSLTGSGDSSSSLVLHGNSSAAPGTASLVQVGSAVTDLNNTVVALQVLPATLNQAGSGNFTALDVGFNAPSGAAFTWTTTVGFAGAGGARLFRFSPILTNKSDAGYAIASVRGLTSAYRVRADGGGGAFTSTQAEHSWVYDATSYDRINSGILTVTQSNTVNSVPSIGPGCTLTTRRGLFYQERASTGTQATSVAVDVADQTVSTLAAAVRSAVSAAAGKWGLLFTGTANNSLNGPLVVGASSGTPTNASVGLEVQSTTLALLLPRMTTAQKNAMTAVNGMVVYDSDIGATQSYVSGAWASL